MDEAKKPFCDVDIFSAFDLRGDDSLKGIPVQFREKVDGDAKRPSRVQNFSGTPADLKDRYSGDGIFRELHFPDRIRAGFDFTVREYQLYLCCGTHARSSFYERVVHGEVSKSRPSPGEMVAE